MNILDDKTCDNCSLVYKPKRRQQKFCCRQCLVLFQMGKNLRYKEIRKEINKSIFLEESKYRKCLKCRKKFISKGKFNRVCSPCKKR